MSPMVIILGVVLLLVVLLALVGLRGGTKESDIAERLAQYAERPLTLEEIELQKPFRERVLVPLMNNLSAFIARRMPRQTVERLRTRLQMAGNPIQAGTFFILQLALTVILGIGGFFLFSTQTMDRRLLLTLLMTVMGYVLPNVWLNNRVRSRQKAILKALPDAIDLLTISVEAGLGFDLAMQRVVEKWNNELSREFDRVLADIRLGKNRREALRDLVARTGVPDLSTFVAAIIQADQLGVSIAKILRVQADQLRIRRRQRAEELAHQAPIKMLFPLVFLIFPSMFVVILGPAVPILWDQFFAKK
ncbi:MAG: type II secretion system F family protein [Chloroflexia bacterium]